MITSHPLSCCCSGLNRLHLDLHLSLTSLFSPRQPEGTREHLSQVLLLPTHSPPGLPTHSPRVKAQVPSTPRDPEWPVCPTPPTHLRLRALTSPFPPPCSSCSSHMGLLPAPPTYQVDPARAFYSGCYLHLEHPRPDVHTAPSASSFKPLLKHRSRGGSPRPWCYNLTPSPLFLFAPAHRLPPA